MTDDEIIEDDEKIDGDNDPEQTEEVTDSDDYSDEDTSMTQEELETEQATYQLSGEEEVIKDGIFKEPPVSEIDEEKLLEFLHFQDHSVKAPQRVKNR